MLAKTSDILSHAGIDSLAELEQRLYEELGDATIADVLNQAVGEVFSNAYKCLSVAANDGSSTEWEVREEQSGLLGGMPPSNITIPNGRYAIKLSGKPSFVRVERDGESTRFVKTLLGSMIGDLFAVQGIRAGADPELEYPLPVILGESFGSNWLSVPVLSSTMLLWSIEERENYSLSAFAKDAGLLPMYPRGYIPLEQRLRRCAQRLHERGFITFESHDPNSSNTYRANGKKLARDDIPPKSSGMFLGKDATIAVLNEVREKKMSASRVAEKLFYELSYVQKMLYWLVENGYAEIHDGTPRAERSSMLATTRAHKLAEYLEMPLSILGLDPAKRPDRIWKPLAINARKLISYREILVDPLHSDPIANADFEATCRTAYQRHIAYRERNGRSRNYFAAPAL